MIFKAVRRDMVIHSFELPRRHLGDIKQDKATPYDIQKLKAAPWRRKKNENEKKRTRHIKKSPSPATSPYNLPSMLHDRHRSLPMRELLAYCGPF
jgi:ABC-type oligopeptide transport system ATPase subunit